MCGIAGFINSNGSTDSLIEMLRRLEYRGYDSAGISFFKNKEICCIKSVGKIADLAAKTTTYQTKIGIGHTRWATHGEVNESNCHPHFSKNHRILVVHNGVIENYRNIKEDYFKNEIFSSQTDSEVIPFLIEKFASSDSVLVSIRKTIQILKGTFSFLVLDTADPDKMYFAKNKTPLLLGMGNKSKIIASDQMAFDESIKKFVSFADQSFGYITEEEIYIDNLDLKVKNKVMPFVNDYEDISKQNFDSYMLKEIYEQPEIIRNLAKVYPKNFKYLFLRRVKQADEIVLIGAGTSYYAACYAQQFMEDILRCPVHVYLASEYAYYPKISSKNTEYFFLSQSGETADLIKVAELMKASNCTYNILTNNTRSTLALQSKQVIDICAKKEIAVASTKAYSAMIIVLYLMCMGCINKKDTLLLDLCLEMEHILLDNDKVYDISNKVNVAKKVFYLGRGYDYQMALEGALKLKEITYMNVTAYPSGELKHGTLSLVDEDTLVVSLISDLKTNSIARSNIEEAKSRGAKVVVISSSQCSKPQDDLIYQCSCKYISNLSAIIFLQLIAYKCSKLKGIDVDKPKNLAKSVTVE